MGYERFARSDEQIVFGHEFCGEVAEHGPRCRKGAPTWTPVVALPLLRGSGGVDTVGLSVHAPGAYAEQLIVEESLMMPVPNGLGSDVAALTEPMAVAWHAVRRGDVGKRTVAIVIGCGPIGLAVILLPKAKRVRRLWPATIRQSAVRWPPRAARTSWSTLARRHRSLLRRDVGT
jgi:threonine dehydrogenase-like Zn-dependent dehydrogenase